MAGRGWAHPHWPIGVVGENINGTANLRMTNAEVSRQLTPFPTPMMHQLERGGQRRDVELWSVGGVY